jgi:hypothetical protein
LSGYYIEKNQGQSHGFPVKSPSPRDFESPQHASECHLESAVPGYVDYGICHGATLKVAIEQGRFVFCYQPVEMTE